MAGDSRMTRSVLVLLWVAVLSAAGCRQEAAPDEPQVALGDKPGQLMPVGRPGGDLSTLADQTTVKTAPPVTVSYDPLPPINPREQAEATVKKWTPRPAAAGAAAGDAAAAPSESGDETAATTSDGKKRSRMGSLLSSGVRLLGGKKPSARSGDGDGTASPTASAPADEEEEAEESDDEEKDE